MDFSPLRIQSRVLPLRGRGAYEAQPHGSPLGEGANPAVRFAHCPDTSLTDRWRSTVARIAREQETIIRFNEEDQDIELWSASPRMHRQMKKNGIEPDQISPGRPGAADREESRSYHFPRNYLKIAPKRRVSEE